MRIDNLTQVGESGAYWFANVADNQATIPFQITDQNLSLP